MLALELDDILFLYFWFEDLRNYYLNFSIMYYINKNICNFFVDKYSDTFVYDVYDFDICDVIVRIFINKVIYISRRVKI